MRDWTCAVYLQIAISYVNIHIYYRYRNYSSKSSNTYVNNLCIPIPDHYMLPCCFIATSRQPPEVQPLLCLPQLPTLVTSAVPYQLLQDTISHLSSLQLSLQSPKSPFISWFSLRTLLPHIEIIVTIITTVTKD